MAEHRVRQLGEPVAARRTHRENRWTPQCFIFGRADVRLLIVGDDTMTGVGGPAPSRAVRAKIHRKPSTCTAYCAAEANQISISGVEFDRHTDRAAHPGNWRPRAGSVRRGSGIRRVITLAAFNEFEHGEVRTETAVDAAAQGEHGRRAVADAVACLPLARHILLDATELDILAIERAVARHHHPKFWKRRRSRKGEQRPRFGANFEVPVDYRKQRIAHRVRGVGAPTF